MNDDPWLDLHIALRRLWIEIVKLFVPPLKSFITWISRA